MTRKATRVASAPAPDAPLNPVEKAAATARTPEQQALIDREKEALAKHDAEEAAAGRAPGVPAPSALEALKNEMLGSAHPAPSRTPESVDAPARAPRIAHGPDAYKVDGGDKMDNLATRFHQEQDEVAANIEDPLSRRARAHAGMPVSEEDRRRAIVDSQLGVDTFPREAGEGRPNEPTLQQCNAQFFKETDEEMARKVQLQESVGDVLHQAFGPQGGKRVLKNLR